MSVRFALEYNRIWERSTWHRWLRVLPPPSTVPSVILETSVSSWKAGKSQGKPPFPVLLLLLLQLPNFHSVCLKLMWAVCMCMWISVCVWVYVQIGTDPKWGPWELQILSTLETQVCLPHMHTHMHPLTPTDICISICPVYIRKSIFWPKTPMSLERGQS